ncbi:hypothetical protein KEM55_003394, partial [Ascosphaera atra]
MSSSNNPATPNRPVPPKMHLPPAVAPPAGDNNSDAAPSSALAAPNPQRRVAGALAVTFSECQQGNPAAPVRREILEPKLFFLRGYEG